MCVYAVHKLSFLLVWGEFVLTRTGGDWNICGGSWVGGVNWLGWLFFQGSLKIEEVK